MKPFKKAMRPMTTRQSSRFILVAILSFLVTCSSQVVCAKEDSSPEKLLLKDYRPRSIYKTPRTSVEKAKYPVIDMHAHAYAKTHKQIAGWVRLMDEVGIDKAIILTGTTGKAFDDIYAGYAKYPDRFEVWCGLDYTGYNKSGFGPAAVRELERCHKVGARGVGELGDKGSGLFYSKPTKAIGMHLDDPRMDQLLEKCAELQMPVNIHVADPYWMYESMDATNDGLMNAYKWRLDNKPNIVNHSGMLEILERGIKRHPRTTFIACHFANCSDDLSRLGRLFDEYPNLYADISARYAETAAIPRYVARFYERYQDRLVYGTDMGFNARMYRLTFRILESADEHFYAWEQFSYHWPLYGLALNDRVLRKVYRDNAVKILRSHISGSKLSVPEVAVENPVPQAADLVIRNAKIVTIDQDNPRAQAIAFKGQIIVAVTSNKAIEKYIKEGFTEIIDAQGRLVVPGFNDAHIHFDFIDPDYIDLRYIRDPGIITEKVKEAVAKSRPGELIRGGHWEHEMFYNRQWPTKELIDPVAPNNPVVLSRADGHSDLVNSYVIRNSGITKDTPDPFGGEIQRDPATGEPTGIFKEKAQFLLKYGQKPVQRTAKEKQERLMRGWQAAFDMAARCGVTSIQVPSGGNLDIYQKFKDMGKLTLRVYIGGSLTTDKQRLTRYNTLQKKYPREGSWIRFGYLKGFIDGTLGSGTALFFDPYVDVPQTKGLPQMSYQELEKLVVTLDKTGFQLGIHAIGDKANHWVLNACEKAQQLNGKRDSRHRIEHAQVLGDDDIPRFAALGVVASMQPTHCITDKRFAEKRIGTKRCRGAYAWQRLLDEKTMIAFGSDYPVEPTNPLEGLYAAVTRKDRAGETGYGWFPDQKLSMEKAIELYTLGSAYAEFMEDRKGIIKEGYLGDVVIFNNDLMSIPHDQIMSTKVAYTIVGGEIVYKRKAAN